MTLDDVCRVLARYGYSFDGGSEAARTEIAQEWRDHGFSAAEVDEWCEYGCWDPETAAELRDDGYPPMVAQSRKRIARLRAGQSRGSLAANQHH